jgi:hypothetical protein
MSTSHSGLELMLAGVALAHQVSFAGRPVSMGEGLLEQCAPV